MNKRTAQKGQIMPLGIALIMFSVLMVIVVYNSGQLAGHKTRLVNAADAAVYSGLLWQSRALNFQSYTNRAMVANQVTMAQAVSLKSWSLYGRIAAENVNSLLGSIPYLGVLTTAMQNSMNAVANVIDPISTALLSLVNAVNGVLSQAQTAMYVTTFVATPEIVKNIASRNDPGFNTSSAFAIAQAGANLEQWSDFTESYDTDHELGMNVRADLINRSRDNFSADRHWEMFERWFFIAPTVRVKLHKRGETRLVASASGHAPDANAKAKLWEWKGKDTLSLNTKIWRPIRKDKKIELPIGWGQALANQSRGERSIDSHCNVNTPLPNSATGSHCERWFDYNRSAEYSSDTNTKSLRGSDSREKLAAEYNGIRAYRDLAALGAQEKDPRLTLHVEITSPLQNSPNARSQGVTGVLSANGKVNGGQLASIASGEVYFKKPVQPGARDYIEYANGYNPFWDVRLINTPEAIRLAVWSQHDSSLVSNAGVAVADSTDIDSVALGAYVEPHSGSTVEGSSFSTGDTLESTLGDAALTLAALQTREPTAIFNSSDALATTTLAAGNIADAQTQTLEQEFNTIRALVVQKYEQGLISITEIHAAEILILQAQLSALQQALNTDTQTAPGTDDSESLTATESEALEIRIGELQAQLALKDDEIRLAKAQLLVESVNSSTGIFQLDIAAALQIIDLQSETGENLVDSLRFSCSDSDSLDVDDYTYKPDKDCHE